MKESSSNLLKEIIDKFLMEIEEEKIINDPEILNNLRNLFLKQEAPNAESLKTTLFPVRIKID